MIIVLGIYLVIVQSTAQSTCTWEDFSLTGAQGYEIQCVDPDGEHAIGYTPCMSYALCQGQRYQSVYFNRFNGQCQYYLAEWDEGETVPQFNYDDDGIRQWTFYYQNGQYCNATGENREFTVNWKCDPNAIPFSTNTVCKNDPDDECLTELTILSSYACVEGPPPNTECKWGNFDLTSVVELGIPIICEDFTNKVFEYTPCESAATCGGQQFQATVRINDDLCLSLSQWDYGVTSPTYFNNGGSAAWMFNYRNGQETSQCPDGNDFRITWECNPQCDPYCLSTQCAQVNECGYSLTIESVLACRVPDEDMDLNENDNDSILNRMQTLIENHIFNN